MEDIQKYITDRDLKKIMKEAKGIGMPSSRAQIIKDLITTGYMEVKGKGLYITQSGKDYIEYIGDHSIVNPELSAEWETHIKNVRQGTEAYEPVREQILGYVDQTVDEVMNREFEVHEKKASSLTCPLCKKPLRKTKFGYGCTGYPECKFLIGEVAHKKLTDKQISDLLTKRQTGVIKGFKKKDGGKFDAILKLENGKIAFAFPPRNQ